MHPILARPGRLRLYLLAWLPLAALLVAVIHRFSELSWGQATALGAPLALLYAFMCLAAAYPCRSMPISVATLARITLGQMLAALLSAALWLFLATNWVVLLEQVPGWSGITERFARIVPEFLIAGVLLYGTAAAGHYLVLAFEHAREHERAELELRVLAREAELKALRAQLDPHFMFNALNSISALTATDPAGARRMCTLLAELLRETLRLGSRGSVTLAEELALVERYLAVETVRFGERLRVSTQVEPGTRDLPVPPLIAQPLVENAVRHGIARLVEGGEVTISARRAGGTLWLAVENPVDDAASPARGTGLGLANVRSRLEALPGGDGRCEVSRQAGRFRVELQIPVEAMGVHEASREARAVGDEPARHGVLQPARPEPTR